MDALKPTAKSHAPRIHQSSCLIDRTSHIRVKNRAATKTVARTMKMRVTAEVPGPRSATMLNEVRCTTQLQAYSTETRYAAHRVSLLFSCSLCSHVVVDEVESFTIVPPMNRCSTCMKARMRYAHAPGLLFSLAHSGGEIGWRKRLPGAIKGDGRDLEALTVLHDLNRRKLAGVLAMSGGKEGSA